jgi:endonuclease YncB( thermonuclease family)
MALAAASVSWGEWEMATLAFLLLIAALVVFSVSTRQWPIWVRGAVWGGGLLMLIVAWMMLGDTARDPELGAAFADFFAHIGNPGDSMLARMLDSNGAGVARIVLSLFDIFLVLGVIVAILALVAFSPGEGMEKVIRPIMSGTVGAIIGGLIALAIVGTGFGQREERQAYAGPVLSETVHTGDTLLLNGDLVRVRGIDAPEPGQVCRLGARTQDCGQEATLAMRRILEGAFVMCALERDGQPQSTGSQPQNGSGERIVTCTAVRNGQEFSVARRIVEEGYAAPQGDAYQTEAQDALTRTRGLTAWCTLRPDVWAGLNNAQRTAFRERGVYERGWATFGTCPPPPRRPSGQTPAVSAPD